MDRMARPSAARLLPSTLPANALAVVDPSMRQAASPQWEARGRGIGRGLALRLCHAAANASNAGPKQVHRPAGINRTGATPPLPGGVPYNNAWFQFGPAGIPDCQETVMRLRTDAGPFPKNIFPQTLVNARTTLVQRSYERLPVPLPGRAAFLPRARLAHSCNGAAAVSSRPLWDPAFAPRAAGGNLPSRRALHFPAGPGSPLPRRDLPDVATYAGRAPYSFAEAGQC